MASHIARNICQEQKVVHCEGGKENHGKSDLKKQTHFSSCTHLLTKRGRQETTSRKVLFAGRTLVTIYFPTLTEWHNSEGRKLLLPLLVKEEAVEGK